MRISCSAAKRTSFLPDVPTIEEALKVRDYNITVTFGMLVPAGAPGPVVDRLHTTIASILNSAEFKATLAKLGTDHTPVLSQADLSAWLTTETARWRRIIDLTHIYGD